VTLIDNLTDAADQTAALVLSDNTTATLRLRYRPRTQRWIADVGYAPNGFQVNGLTLTCYPNILRPWRRLIPFGLAFMTADQTDPFDLNDFLTGRVSAYLLDAADVQQVEDLVIGRP
jgi:hypothetical protein